MQLYATTTPTCPKMAENLENQMEASSSAEDVKPQKHLLFEQFIKKVEHSIPKVDYFLKKIITTYRLDIKPINMEFLKMDKFFEVWVCLISPRMTKLDNSLIFDDETCFTRQQLELIYGVNFVYAFVEFLLSLQAFSQIELKLFTTVAVLSNNTYSDTLSTDKHYFFDNDKDAQKLKDFCASLFNSSILPKLMKLRELAKQHNNAIEWLCKNYWPKLDISKLIALRLNIPITNDMRTSSLDLRLIAKIVAARKIHLWNGWANVSTIYMEKRKSSAHACLESLTKKDQECLIKHGLVEVWFCETSAGYMTINPKGFRPMSSFRKQLELMYGPDFVNAFTKTLLSLQAYQLSTLEMKLFQDIVLLNQRPGLVDVEAVQKLQDLAIEKFSAERLKNQTNDVDIPTLDIPQMLSKLQALSLLHSNSLDWLKENSNKVNLPAFFCELFDIPNVILKKV